MPRAKVEQQRWLRRPPAIASPELQSRQHEHICVQQARVCVRMCVCVRFLSRGKCHMKSKQAHNWSCCQILSTHTHTHTRAVPSCLIALLVCSQVTNAAKIHPRPSTALRASVRSFLAAGTATKQLAITL